MITDEELVEKLVEEMMPHDLAEKIVQTASEYHGFINEFYEAVGMVVVGKLFGWRVMRLVSSRRCWIEATKIFGDPKKMMPERGKFAYRSVGLGIVDKMGGYWDVISGRGNRDDLSISDRKTMK
jgi:hypothetical protein